MGNGQVGKNFVELLVKLTESGDLPGLDMEPDDATGKYVGGMAVRISRGSKQVAMALIGPERFILTGDEIAEKLAAKIGVQFIHARDLAKQVVAGYRPEDLAKLVAENLPSELAEEMRPKRREKVSLPMLRARLSYGLEKMVNRILPERMASSVVRALGLKLCVTPAALAASLLYMAGGVLRAIDESFADTQRKGVTARSVNADYERVAAEILCSFFWMSLSVLSEDEFASDRGLYRLYTTMTLQELESLAFEKVTFTVCLEDLAEETSNFYLGDGPTLTELATQMPGYILEEEIKRVEDMKNWTCTFILKAQTRIFKALDMRAGSFGASPIVVDFVGAMDLSYQAL